TSGNSSRFHAADSLAESGVNLAMYYLQNPSKAPALNASGYWAGTSGDIAIGSSVAGTMNVTVAQDSSDKWAYEVTSVGKSATVNGTQVSRTAQARVYVRSQYPINYTLATAANTTLFSRTSVTGDVLCTKSLTLNSGSSVTGQPYCTGLSQPAGGTLV